MITVEITEIGSKWWFKDNLEHRDNGPAILKTNGHQSWYNRGKWHRLDGPAIKWPDGTYEYWINGQEVTEYEHMFLASNYI